MPSAQPSRRDQIFVISSITLGYSFYYLVRLSIGVVKTPMIDAGLLTEVQFGWIGSALLYAYAIGKFTNGFIADHVSIRRFFVLGLCLSACLNFAFGFANTLWVWIVLWGLNGWVQGFGSPSSGVALAHWFKQTRRGELYGLWSSAHSIGEGMTFLLTAFLVASFGWRAGFMGPGLICLLIAYPLYKCMRDRPSDSAQDREQASRDRRAQIRIQLSLLRTPAFLVLGLASATMTITRYAILSWGAHYLQKSRGYTLTEAGGLIGLTSIMGIVGSIGYGLVSDRLYGGRRPPATLLFGLLEILALYMILFSPVDSQVLTVAAFCLYGLTLSGLLAALGGLFAIDLADKRASGAAMGIIGLFSYIAAATQDSVSGYLIGRGKSMVAGAEVYDFGAVSIFWLASSVVSLILASSLWRTRSLRMATDAE